MSGRRGRRRSRVRPLPVLLCLLAMAWAYAYWTLSVPMGKGPAKLVVVARGESVLSVGNTLEREGLIRSARVFVAYAYLTRKHGRIQAGRHELAPTMDAREILDALCYGTHRAWRWVTIPEGYTLRQIAEAAGKELGSSEGFLQAAAAPASLAPGFPLPESGVEGYLFPDTYRLDADATAKSLVAQMLRRFREVVWKGLLKEKPSYHGRSLQQIVTLASLVEAEAKQDKERAVIAGVLTNRLAQGRRLECDATVQYALGVDRKQRLLYKDLEIDSEYNTYRHAGLPPGPICSPGEASLKAAMEPASVSYLYYVAKPDGSHVFSNTFAEHTAAIARVRQSASGGAR